MYSLEARVRMSSLWRKPPAEKLLTERPTPDIWRSFRRGSITRRKRVDDRIDPCLTPLLIGKQLDNLPSSFTCHDRPHNYYTNSSRASKSSHWMIHPSLKQLLQRNRIFSDYIGTCIPYFHPSGTWRWPPVLQRLRVYPHMRLPFKISSFGCGENIPFL